MSPSTRITIEPVSAEPPTAPKRRKHSIAEKRRIVEESFQPGTSVARVARAYGVNANQVFTWRRQYASGRLGGEAPTTPGAALLPIMISESAAVAEPAPNPPAGTIQLQLPKGRLRIEGAADPQALRVVMECLLG